MNLKKLKEKSLKIIEKEQLPKVKEFIFKKPMRGYLKRLGTCIKFRDGTYKIIIYTRKAKWFEDKNGTHISKITRKTIRRAIIGEDLNDEEMLKNVAHEIAHLKHWRHNNIHKKFTEYIYNLLKNEFSEMN